MKRVISSRLTFFYKFVLPVLLSAYGGIGLIILFVKPPNTDFFTLLCIFLLLIIGSVLLYQAKKKLKKVWVDETALYISDYFDEISVPFCAIENVRETWPDIWGSTRFPNRQITISLKTESKFGREIVCGTRIELFEQPTGIDLLNQLVSAAKT